MNVRRWAGEDGNLTGSPLHPTGVWQATATAKKPKGQEIMRLMILDNYELASEWAAKYVRNKIKAFKPGPDRYFVLGLPTGELNKILQ